MAKLENGSKAIQEYTPAELELTARVLELDDRKARVTCDIVAGDQICVTGEVVAIRVSAES